MTKFHFENGKRIRSEGFDKHRNLNLHTKLYCPYWHADFILTLSVRFQNLTTYFLQSSTYKSTRSKCNSPLSHTFRSVITDPFFLIIQ